MNALRILLIEDNPGDAELVKQALADAGGAYQLTVAGRLSEGLARLAAEAFEAVLLDLSLPDSFGVDTVARVRSAAPGVPIVVFTVSEGDEQAIAAIQHGAQDYLVKGQAPGSLIVRTLRYASERLRQHEALRRAERDLAALIESAPDGMGLVQEAQWVFANSVLARSLGHPDPAALLHRPVSEFVHPDDRSGSAWLWDEAVPPGAGTPVERRFLRPDGQACVLEVAPGPVVEFQGNRARLLVTRDISERRELESRLQLADRLASMGTLAAGVAHEINNPLAYVIGNLDAIAQRIELLPPLPGQPAVSAPADRGVRGIERVAQLVARAREGAERVRSIVRDLKGFSRAEVDEIRPIDVRGPLDSALRLASNEIRHRASLVKDYRQPPLVDANEGRLAQVFLNLLVNAAQAIPEGSADRHQIRLATGADEGGRAFVEVRDTGEGIAPEVLSRIFDPFFTTKAVGAGTGLGLSVSHSIVAALGGEISVTSRKGEGTAFRVVLPASKASAQEERRAPAVAPAAPQRRGRILVVDDEPDVGETLIALLSDAHEVVAVTSGGAALARLSRGERFDLILCDLMMPVMTGMDLFEMLARTLPEQARKMVFLTGGAFTPRARAFLAGRSARQLDKPFGVEELQALVARQLAPAAADARA